MPTYIVTMDNGFTVEEYDGGKTIAEARKEAAFFCESLPYVGVSICTVDREGRLHVQERVQERKH